MSDTAQPQAVIVEVAAEASRKESPVYTIDGLQREFRQAEIVSNVAQYNYDAATGRASEVYHEYVIIFSQDCDLLWDFEAREKGEDPDLNGILLYEIEPADQVRNKMLPKNKEVWKRVCQNREERYHYLENVPIDQDLINDGCPPLVIDFKRCFTINPPDLSRQTTLTHGARRRCRLEAPYREHLQSRAAFYLQRVMLPLPHKKLAESV